MEKRRKRRKRRSVKDREAEAIVNEKKKRKRRERAGQVTPSPDFKEEGKIHGANNSQRIKGRNKKTQSKWLRLVNQLFNLIYYVMVIGLILGSTMFALNKDSNKSYFGYRFYTVLTNSMVPQKDSLPGGFYAGDIIVVKMIDGKEAKVNDVVTFSVGESDQFLTHRVVKKLPELNGEEGDFIVTRGDANDSDDPPFTSKRIVGKTLYVIPNVGKILEFVRNNFVVCTVFILSLFGFVLIIRFYFTDTQTNNARKKVSQQ